MTNTKKFTSPTAIAVSALFISATLAGCASSPAPSGDIRVSVLYTNEINGFKLAAADYEKKHPGTKVEIDAIPYATYEATLKTQILGGSAPDVMQLEPPVLTDFERAKYLADQDSALQSAPYSGKGTWSGTFLPGTVDSLVAADGKQYGIPFSNVDVRLYYDANAYEKAGITSPATTWSEFISDQKKLAGSSANPPLEFQYNGSDYQPAWIMTPMLDAVFRPMTAEINLRHAKGWKFDYKNPSSVKGETYTADELYVAFKKGIIDPAKSAGYRKVVLLMKQLSSFAPNTDLTSTQPWQSLAAGKTAQALTLGSVQPLFASQAKQSGYALKLGVANVPTITSTNVPGLTDGGVNPVSGVRNVLALNKASKNSKVATDFMKFITTKDELQRVMGKFTGNVDPAAVKGVQLDSGTGGASSYSGSPKFATISIYGFGGFPTFDTKDKSEFDAQWERYMTGSSTIDEFLTARSASNLAALTRNLQVYKDSVDQAFIKKELG